MSRFVAPLQGANQLGVFNLGFRFASPQAIIFVAFSDRDFGTQKNDVANGDKH